MEKIEDKLKQYRFRKRRQEQIQGFKEGIRRILMLEVKDKNEKHKQPDETKVTIHASMKKESPESLSALDEDTNSDDILLEEGEECFTDESSDPDHRFFKYTLRVVYLALWMTLYIIFIELQFGIVFLIISTLAGIYLNTRTGPKDKNEISAYSVFNKNCESIDGTLKAEQLERQFGIR